MDLIFECYDLIKSDYIIDWQSLCLGTEKLFLDYEWYDKSGLKHRGRTLQLLGHIRGTFLEMLEQKEGV